MKWATAKCVSHEYYACGAAQHFHVLPQFWIKLDDGVFTRKRVVWWSKLTVCRQRKGSAKNTYTYVLNDFVFLNGSVWWIAIMMMMTDGMKDEKNKTKLFVVKFLSFYSCCWCLFLCHLLPLAALCNPSRFPFEKQTLVIFLNIIITAHTHTLTFWRVLEVEEQELACEKTTSLQFHSLFHVYLLL